MTTVLERGADAVIEPECTPVKMKDFFRAMVTIRAMDERMLALQRQGRLGFYLPSTGQEAAQIGSAAAIRPDDWVAPSYRDQGVALWRGVTIEDIVAQCYGNANDPTHGRQMPVHYSFKKANFLSISSPIGTQTIQATGVAWAMQILKHDRVVLTFMGDGSTSSNDFHTGLNFAGVRKSPVIFFCNNNQWAISVPLKQQTASETIAIKANAYGFEGVRVDGNDVLAVYQVTKKAVAKARAGGGPTLIESVTYRMGPHSSSDDPTRYQGAAERELWKQRDPIERYRKFLMGRGVLNEKEEEEIWAQAKQAVVDAVAKQESAPPPALQTMFDDVYAEMPWNLKEQMDRTLSEGGHTADKDAAFPL